MANKPIFTFGHSTLPLSEAVQLLRLNDIDLLVDARSHPGSKHCPQWNRNVLENHLREYYVWKGGLGGWRADNSGYEAYERFLPFGVDVSAYLSGFPKQRIARKTSKELANPGDQPYWTVLGFYDYQFAMTLDEFRRDTDWLLSVAQGMRVAYMCSELQWWRCHRSMIADYLTLRSAEVIHLQPRVTRHVEVLGDRIDRYHPYVIDQWMEWMEEDNRV